MQQGNHASSGPAGDAANVWPRAFLLLTVGLATALAGFTWTDGPLRPYRLAIIVAGVVAGLVRLRVGVLSLVALAPVLGLIPRCLGVGDLSLAEHMLVPLLLCGAASALGAKSPRPPTAIDRPLASYLALVVLSAGRGLWEYHGLDPPLWRIVPAELMHHFSFAIWDFTRGPFLLVHYTIVALEGALWFALLTAPATRVRAAHLRAALVLGTGLVAAIGITQGIWHFGLPEFFRAQQPELIRINASLPDPNTFGSFVILVGPLVVVAGLGGRCGRAQAIGWTATLGYCLARTVSRTAWLGLAATLFTGAVALGWRGRALGLALSPRATRWLRASVALVLGASLAAVVAVSCGAVGRGISYRSARSPLEMLVFTLDVRRPLSDVLPARIEHWRAALDIWADFPLLGAGTGKYTLLKNRYLPEARSHWLFFTEPHNYFLKQLAELGLVGLAAFLWVLGGVGAEARRAWTAGSSAQRRRVTAITVGLAAFTVSMLGQDPLTLCEMQYVFWSVVALLVLETREGIAGADDSATAMLAVGARTW